MLEQRLRIPYLLALQLFANQPNLPTEQFGLDYQPAPVYAQASKEELSSRLGEEADKLKEKKLQGISDLRDESDRDGMRIVIELKTGTNSDVVLNNLYNFTRLQETFGIIMLGLVNDEPKVLGLKDIIHEFIDHRKIIIRKRILYDLKQAEDRSHILEGIIIALNNIDAVIKLIKSSTIILAISSLY